jgi:hypothetical protein
MDDYDLLDEIQNCNNGNDILIIVKNYGLDVNSVYDCMTNKYIEDIIEDIMSFFIKNENFIYMFIDGWIDFWTRNEMQSNARNYCSNKTFEKFRNVLIKFIRNDNFKTINSGYKVLLKKHFDINFDAEIMIG